MKRIIIIAGGFLQLPLIRTALAMDLHVTVFDGDEQALGFGIANHYIVCDITNPDECVKKAQELHSKNNIHAVITAGTDMSDTVACIAHALRLFGIDPKDALAAKNKVLMRKRLHDFKILQPDFRGLWKFSEVHQAMDVIGLPLVLKPAQNMGARGVIKIEKREEIYDAYRHSKKFSKSGELILEKYILGKELSIDALAWIDSKGKQQIKMTGIADRIITGEPWFIELGHTMPSQLPIDILQKAEVSMKKSMLALGIHTGAAKGDLKVTEDGNIYIGEVAARLSGGFMSSHTYPLSSGVDLLKNAIMIALTGQPDDLSFSQNKIVIERCIIGPAGKITAFEGQENIQATEGIDHVFFMKQKGDILHNLNSNIGKAGHIIASSDSLEAAQKSVDQALKHLIIETDDSWAQTWKEIETQARKKFSDDICIVCKTCDGLHCASGIPGMGGPGHMKSFQDNIIALSEYKISTSYIHENIQPNTKFTLFSESLSTPIMTAPMTGASTNLKNAISEYDLARNLLLACKESNTVAWLGDGASPEKYKIILQAVRDTNASAVLICKPRADTNAILERFREAKDSGVIAVGIDIDSISLKTMQLRKLKSHARNTSDLEKIKLKCDLPFILKGIINTQDAQAALDIGADAIVVSNHGGRILDEMPGTARVLPEISSLINSRIPVLVDGGIRSGVDVFKMLSLGADGVLIGRMVAIAAVGNGKSAVKHLLRVYQEDLLKSMKLCGVKTINDMTHKNLLNINPRGKKL